MSARRSGVVMRAPNLLGDLVMALPAFQAVRPRAIVIRRSLAAFCAELVPDTSVIPFGRGATELWQAARTVRRQRFQRAIVLPNSFSSALMMALAGVPERRGSNAEWRSLILTEPVTTSRAHFHQAARYMEIATGTLPAEPPFPRVAPSGPARERVAAIFGRWWNPARPPVGLFPGAAPARRWRASRFRELMLLLRQAGDEVVVMGGPGEVAITREVSGQEALDLGGRLELPELAAALAACSLVVTNDTGPMHLAAAVGTPVVAFFGPDTPERSRPLTSARRVLWHSELPCSPCLRGVCPRTGPGTVLPSAAHECMELITVDDTMAAIASLRAEVQRGR